MSESISRRGLIAGSAAAPVMAAVAPPAGAQVQSCPGPAASVQAALRAAAGTKLVILGSGSGPLTGRVRNAACHVMLSNGAAYILDCGLGVTDKFSRTGIPWGALRSVFITHHHPDHNIEFGPLLVLGWLQGMSLGLRAYGPPPLRQMTTDFLRAYRTTLDFWAEDFKLPELNDIAVQEVAGAGPVMADENVRVRAILVNHPPVKPALGYRFDFRDRSIAFSGDTTPLEAVAEMAKGADVLVHEAILMAALEADMRARLARGLPGNIEAIMAHMRADHSPVEAVGRIAAEAGVKSLVLSHLAGPDSLTDDDWRAPAARFFKGEIIVAHDMIVV